MNKQLPNQIEWTHVFGPGTGYTWNPVQGCQHDCHWTMPDGAGAQCYAKTIAEGRFRSATFFPDGFASHYFHPERLDEPAKLKKPAGIFLDSMSDLMGHWVSDDVIRSVFDACAAAPQHVFFLLTKNPVRLPTFEYPANVWVGMSVPPTRMNGVALSLAQQARWLSTGLAALNRTHAAVRWLSAEPLSFNVAPLIMDAMLDWCVIGAASNGRRTYQPEAEWVHAAIGACRQMGAKVFFKGNLEWSPRLAEFPAVMA